LLHDVLYQDKDYQIAYLSNRSIAKPGDLEEWFEDFQTPGPRDPGRGFPLSTSSVTGSQCQSATRDLAVGRLDDPGGFPNCLVPDSGVGSARACSAAWSRAATEGRRPMAMAAPQRWSSLLDRTEQEWRDQLGATRAKAAALLAWFRGQVADLAEGTGWDAEYGRDAWQMHRLGYSARRVLDFSGIPQPQLKDMAKRWIRWRLGTGLTLEAGGGKPLRALIRFASFLDGRGITGTSGIDRAVFEDYLADLHAEMNGSKQQGARIGLLDGFFTAVRQHGWDHALPATAMFFPGDQPRRGGQLPRALAGHVMAQVENPGNLARQRDPAYRLATLILIRCGLRVSDALKLPFDCVVTDDSGAPYLRYCNHKMKREALVPIDEELQTLISEQQTRILCL